MRDKKAEESSVGIETLELVVEENSISCGRKDGEVCGACVWNDCGGKYYDDCDRKGWTTKGETLGITAEVPEPPVCCDKDPCEEPLGPETLSSCSFCVATNKLLVSVPLLDLCDCCYSALRIDISSWNLRSLCVLRVCFKELNSDSCKPLHEIPYHHHQPHIQQYLVFQHRSWYHWYIVPFYQIWWN